MSNMAMDDSASDNSERGTRPLPVRPDAFRFKRFRLRAFEGPDKGAEWRSSGNEVVIGVAAGNDVTLTDPTVSRYHCLINATPDGLLLRDLDSSNGTNVGGVRVVSAYLRSGCLLD